MTEREIRDIVLDFLKGSVRQVMLPAAFGVSLALAGCGDGRQVPADDATAEQGAMKYAAPFREAGPIPMYAAAFIDAGVPCCPEYAAPFPDAEPVARYAAPFMDGGNVALYSAPFPAPDAGPALKYAAPFEDGGTAALYAAPFPDPDEVK